MTFLRAGIFLLITTILCGVGGAAVGWMLGRYQPGYYRFVFPRSVDRPDFDPVAVGVGLGVTQGLAAGLIVGCVIIISVSFFGYLSSRRGAGHH